MSVTTEFHAEYEAAREKWLRDRFVWYSGFMAVVGLLLLLQAFFSLDSAGDLLSGEFMAKLLVRGGQVAIFGAAMAFASTRRRDLSRERVLRMVFWCIVSLGVMSLVIAPVASAAMNTLLASGDGARPGIGPAGAWLFLIFVTHFAASVFIPWSPSEAMRPMTPLLILATALALLAPVLGKDSWASAMFAIAVAWMIPLPGLAVAWFRHSRHRSRFHLRALSGRYGAIKRELVDARRIHESIFPGQILAGPVRFAYRYEPMLQLGGDFVFAYPRRRDDGDPDAPLSVVLIDVTGHGIGAALTVNRLDGELRRLYAENPDISPGAVIEALNSYIHLTLAEHSVYATAFCARLDPARSELRWANAGHPPGMYRDAAGRINELISTSFVLGAAASANYDANEQAQRFGPGDTLLLYTDGAFEACDHTGKMFMLDGLRKSLVRSAAVHAGEGALAQRMLGDVEAFRDGPPMDDTLILELTRDTGAVSPAHAQPRPEAAQAD